MGKCPKCGSENLRYATDWGPTGGSSWIFQPITCNNCGLKFQPYDYIHPQGKYYQREKRE